MHQGVGIAGRGGQGGEFGAEAGSVGRHACIETQPGRPGERTEAFVAKKGGAKQAKGRREASKLAFNAAKMLNGN